MIKINMLLFQIYYQQQLSSYSDILRGEKIVHDVGSIEKRKLVALISINSTYILPQLMRKFQSHNERVFGY